ncbi:hypothetical protein ACLOJK_001482 [Asimina triloba]
MKQKGSQTASGLAINSRIAASIFNSILRENIKSKMGQREGEKNSTRAARTAEEVFPEPPFPKKVTSFVDLGGGTEEAVMSRSRSPLLRGMGVSEEAMVRIFMEKQRRGRRQRRKKRRRHFLVDRDGSGAAGRDAFARTAHPPQSGIRQSLRAG